MLCESRSKYRNENKDNLTCLHEGERLGPRLTAKEHLEEVDDEGEGVRHRDTHHEDRHPRVAPARRYLRHSLQFLQGDAREGTSRLMATLRLITNTL